MSKKNTNTAAVETITFSIDKHIAILREAKSERGWQRELNIVTWGDNEPKYDIRDWNKEHNRFSRGLSFSKDELKALAKAINAETKAPAKKAATKAAK